MNDQCDICQGHMVWNAEYNASVHVESNTMMCPTSAKNDMDDEDRAAAAALVQEAKDRAGLGTPELQAQHHALCQTQIPRICAWLNRNADSARESHAPKSLKIDWSGGTGLFTGERV